jgi:UDP-N-acetylmuramyl tripeptide synthase
LDPAAIGSLAARLSKGSVLISATNGKTTTAAMTAGILRRYGLSTVHNAAGANMAGGIAAALLDATGRRGGLAGELGLFEVDEAWLPDVVAELHPRTILLGNLFRDQLDRYGELETIAARWSQAVSEGPGLSALLVLDADDPLVADLGREREDVLYYGLEDDSVAAAHVGHAADAKHCRRCGAPYVFDAVYLGHLGHYHCPACAQARPTPQVYASDVTLNGIHSARFTLHTPAGETTIELPLPGLYNVYNALGAAALAGTLQVPLAVTAAALTETKAAFGRAESATVGTRELRLLLIKNPVGADEVLRTLALEPGEHEVLGVLNDNVADGRDVSWIWDTDFELIAGRIRKVTCSGTRAAELAVRLKYAGVEPARIAVVRELPSALDSAIGARGDGDQSPLYALPTYTAMLALRKLLAKRGSHLGNLS